MAKPSPPSQFYAAAALAAVVALWMGLVKPLFALPFAAAAVALLVVAVRRQRAGRRASP